MSLADEVLSSLYLERHPDEAAAGLEELAVDEAVEVLESQPERVLANLLSRLSPLRADAVLVRLDEPRIRAVLENLDPAVAARQLSRLEESERERYLALLQPRLRAELRELASYPDEVAGAVMESRLLALGPEMSVEATLAAVRTATVRPHEQVFVVDGEGLLLGRVPLADLAVADSDRRLGDLLEPLPAVIGAMAPRDEVAELLGRHRLTSLPVVDIGGRLVGVIRQEALLDAARDEMIAGMQTMVGASKEERALSPAGFAVRKRLPWLEINLGTAFLAAAVVGLFEDTIARVTALAVLLPVVAGQSGNTGAQALAVTMRGLALREIRPRQWATVLGKEMRVGFANGLAVSVTTSALVYLWSHSVGLTAVIGLSMVASMTIAGLSGGAIPLLLVALRQDPAQSSSIILTTVTDVAGFFSFLGIATLMAAYL